MKGLQYEQATGTLRVVNGGHATPIAKGYAGRGAGRDNPSRQQVRNEGPLPQGRYSMWVVEHRRFVSPAIKLAQTEGETYGRSGFWIHGDNRENDASQGCIVLDRRSRECIAALMQIGFNQLWVIP